METGDAQVVAVVADLVEGAESERPVVIDEARLDRLEAEFADAAETLEAVERIQRSQGRPSERADAMRALVADGRFLVAEAVEAAQTAQTAQTRADLSDLVGHRDVDTAEQVHAVPEAESAVVSIEPSGPEVGEPLEP